MADASFDYAPAAASILRALQTGIRPQPKRPLSEWMPRNVVLVDGPLAGSMWDAAGAPYLAEIADCLTDSHPCNTVTIRKSQQTGASILALAWALYVADQEPANMLYVAPGIDMLRDLNSQKFDPLISAWQKRIGRVVIAPQTSRSGAGSTTYEKKFAGGYIALGNANAVMDLSSKTVKKGVKDELSKWQDIPGHGDPETLFMGRFTAFRRTKDYKILEISTPEEDSGVEDDDLPAWHCRIDKAFRQSDQRFWNVPCPSCGAFQRLDLPGLRINRERPALSTYECVHCGHQISEAERVGAVRRGKWVPTAVGHPGFHIDAFVSLMMSFEAIAEDWLAAEKQGEKGLKDFNNLVRGLPYRYRGEAPDHVRLMERREDIPRGRVPTDVLMLTAMADVQHNGIYVEVVGWTPNKVSVPIEATFLDGDTTDHRSGAFAKLSAIYDRGFLDAWERRRRIDAFGVDAGDNQGGRANQVYAWCGARANAYALRGADGWHHPAIGTPKLVDIDLDGKRLPHGGKLWRTGTWGLKREFYDALRRQRGVEGGETFEPHGYCRFPLWLDETYFKQITSETLEDQLRGGRVVARKWVARGENHFLDCRVGNMALAEHLGLSVMTAEEWKILARHHNVPEETLQGDLFAPAPIAAQAKSQTTYAVGKEPAEMPAEPWNRAAAWTRNTKNWMKR